MESRPQSQGHEFQAAETHDCAGREGTSQALSCNGSQDVLKLIPPSSAALEDVTVPGAEDRGEPPTAVDAVGNEHRQYLSGISRCLPEVPTPDIVLKGVSLTASIRVDDERKKRIPGIASTLWDQATFRVCRGRRTQRSILSDVNLRLKPGSCTLVFGPPSSGTTSLLKVVAGYLRPSDGVRGEISCNGVPIDRLKWGKITAFCGQYDVQFAGMTVRETLDFASMCLNGAGPLKKMGLYEPESDSEGKADRLINILGLETCRNTILGDELQRGCSSGERKRVTVGEALCGPHRVLVLDKLNAGLDSATTMAICKFLRSWADILRGVVVCHLLQPDPQVVALFDDVVVLERGHIIYNGPPSEGLQHFRSIGFECPPDKDIGSFLSDVAVADNRPRYHLFRMHYSSEEMIQFYESSEQFKRLATAIGQAAGKPPLGTTAAIQDSAFNKEIFGGSTTMGFFSAFCYLCRFQTRSVFKNAAVLMGNIGQQLTTSLLLGWLFFGSQINNYLKTIGIITMVFVVFSSGAYPLTFKIVEQKPVVHKQLRQGYYTPTAYILSYTVVQYLIQIIQTLIFGTITYFMLNMTTSAPRHFFIYLLILFLCYIDFTALYACFLFFFNSLTVAMAVIAIVDLAFQYCNGFTVTYSYIPKYLIWIYYIDFFNYAIKSLAINEFTSAKYIYKDASDLDGTDYLRALDLPTTDRHLWLFIGLLLVFHVLFLVIQIVILTFNVADPFPFSASIEDSKDIAPVSSETLSRIISAEEGGSANNDRRGVVLSFTNINYHLRVKNSITRQKQDIQLLHDVSGYVNSGTMLALMGVSGAGKTTLLDVLANRKTTGFVSGSIRINGREFGSDEFCAVSGYVEQSDSLPATETVREALQFSAAMKNRAGTSKQSLNVIVDGVLPALGLESYSDCQIGEIGSGLPMGIRKLVSIGVELAADPALLFLDEPTTGLDSSTALSVAQTLRSIAASGKSIICTIHQPSQEIFDLFTDVLLLQRGGRTVYFGDSGPGGESVVRFLESFPDVPWKRPDENVACYILEVMEAMTDQANSNKFSSSVEALRLRKTILKSISSIERERRLVGSWGQYSASFCRQLVEVTKRSFRTANRRMDFNVPRIRLLIILSILSGLSYLNLTPTTQSGVLSLWSGLFSGATNIGTMNMMGLTPVFFSFRKDFYREMFSGTYRPTAYWLSLLIVEAVYAAGMVAVFSAIFYPMVNFRHGFTYWISFAASLGLWVLNCILFGLACVFAMPVLPLVQISIGVCVTILCSTSGYSIPYASLKQPWKSVYWINPLNFFLQVTSGDQFECHSSPCPEFQYGPTKITFESFFETMYSVRFGEKAMFLAFQVAALAASVILSYLSVVFIRYIKR